VIIWSINPGGQEMSEAFFDRRFPARSLTNIDKEV
jgi:hypothetical protein